MYRKNSVPDMITLHAGLLKQINFRFIIDLWPTVPSVGDRDFRPFVFVKVVN